jgi:hypothetical protein
MLPAEMSSSRNATALSNVVGLPGLAVNFTINPPFLEYALTPNRASVILPPLMWPINSAELKKGKKNGGPPRL